ncbi:amino acid transporter ant1 [Anaeramoeba ignava]|uniref:Amino acid transporter ant1 n=1 Tax=Anaeramoeba ignava TaxID=1746090 RepID=A0A9Q0LQ67_ANAIG|nr:amino acid transporter ant1 [Anaeramoeba ignava]
MSDEELIINKPSDSGIGTESISEANLQGEVSLNETNENITETETQPILESTSIDNLVTFRKFQLPIVTKFLKRTKTEIPKTGFLQSSFNFFKGFVCTGIIAEPYAFKEAGIVTAIISLVLLSLLSFHTMSILVTAKRFVMNKYDLQYLTFTDIGEYLLGKWGKNAIDFFLFLTQFGFCCAYVIFISGTLGNIFSKSPAIFVPVAFLPLYLLTLIRNVKKLVPYEIAGSFLLLFSLSIVVGIECVDPEKGRKVSAAEWKTLPIFFGIVAYSFEGIGIILPIENSMKKPQKFKKLMGINLFFVTIVYIVFGLLGYLAYGTDTKGNVITNLEQNPLNIVMKSAYVLVVLLTYPLQMFPAVELLEIKNCFRKHMGKKHWELRRNLLRFGLVLISSLIGLAIPQFGLFLSLIGSLGSTALCFILPAVFDIQLRRENGKNRTVWKVKNYAIVIFGAIAAVAGTVVSIQNIISALF